MVGTNVTIDSHVSSYANAKLYKSNSAAADRFEDKVSEIAADKTVTNTGSSKYTGDMVISQPPGYSSFSYDSTLANKPKEEMSMDEYKQWFMNEMSQMPVSGWYRSTCVGGSLVITDAAFEKMKSDPEWENTVMNMVRKMYSTNGIMGSKMIGFQVIGASPEECYGEGIPVDNSTGLSTESKDGESWWQKRHKRAEEIIEEQIEKALQKRQERREQLESEYVEQLYLRQKNMFPYGTNTISSDENAQIQNAAAVLEAYEKNSIVLSDESI